MTDGSDADVNRAMITSQHPSPRTSAPMLGKEAVLVPVKAFADAKRRLGGTIGDDDRRALVRRMAEQVLAASAPLPVAVVCDSQEVADWARTHGALVIWEPGRGLNGAVEDGVRRLAVMGVEMATVAHADLPQASGIGEIESFDGVTLVPDRHDDGTNVIRIPTACGFRFSYGPGSFARHRQECKRIGIRTLILRTPRLGLDVDWPADLEESLLEH